MKFPSQIDVESVAEFINALGPATKVYIGTDSERMLQKGIWLVDYMSVVIVHIEGKKGGKIFGAVTRECDYDRKFNRPSLRLMNEVYKSAELYLALSPLIAHDIEIHLDINPDEEFGSSCVIAQAIGYIKGVCNISPKVKPSGFAASSAADQLKRILGHR
mgnify:FL=1